MTTYRILTPSFVGTVVASGDTIIQAAPVLHWTVGGSFSSARDYFVRRGWRVEPVIDVHPDWLECDNRLFELHWAGETIVRITEHVDGETRDVMFDDLPSELRGEV